MLNLRSNNFFCNKMFHHMKSIEMQLLRLLFLLLYQYKLFWYADDVSQVCNGHQKKSCSERTPPECNMVALLFLSNKKSALENSCPRALPCFVWTYCELLFY